MKAQQIADAVVAHYHHVDNGAPTCDGFVYGDPETEVTGVITTFTVTAEVLKEAMARGANMIITHEPTFFLSAGASGPRMTRCSRGCGSCSSSPGQ